MDLDCPGLNLKNKMSTKHNSQNIMGINEIMYLKDFVIFGQLLKYEAHSDV
jgi:hypothetical protein